MLERQLARYTKFTTWLATTTTTTKKQQQQKKKTTTYSQICCLSVGIKS